MSSKSSKKESLCKSQEESLRECWWEAEEKEGLDEARKAGFDTVTERLKEEKDFSKHLVDLLEAEKENCKRDTYSEATKRGLRSGARKTLKRKSKKKKRTKKKSKKENNTIKRKKSKKSKKSGKKNRSKKSKDKKKQRGGQRRDLRVGDILDRERYNKSSRNYWIGKKLRRMRDKGSYIVEHLPMILDNIENTIQLKIQDQITLFLFGRNDFPDILDKGTNITTVINKLTESGELGKRILKALVEWGQHNQKKITNGLIWKTLLEAVLIEGTKVAITKNFGGSCQTTDEIENKEIINKLLENLNLKYI